MRIVDVIVVLIEYKSFGCAMKHARDLIYYNVAAIEKDRDALNFDVRQLLSIVNEIVFNSFFKTRLNIQTVFLKPTTHTATAL